MIIGQSQFPKLNSTLKNVFFSLTKAKTNIQRIYFTFQVQLSMLVLFYANIQVLTGFVGGVVCLLVK